MIKKVRIEDKLIKKKIWMKTKIEKKTILNIENSIIKENEITNIYLKLTMV